MSILLEIIRKQKSRDKLVRLAGGVLYLDARKANGYELPSNSPLTTPWVDLSGNGNSATPTNMASLITSGVDISDPLRPCWVLDGSDDFFNLSNTSSLDFLAAPIAVFCTIKPSVITGWIFSKVTSSGGTSQYGLSFDSGSSEARPFIQTAQRGSIVISTNWLNVGFIWDGTTVKNYLNCVQGGTNGSLSGAITSKANVRVGCRSNAADGSSNSAFFNGRIGTVTVYGGSKATEANILKAEKQLMRGYV